MDVDAAAPTPVSTSLCSSTVFGHDRQHATHMVLTGGAPPARTDVLCFHCCHGFEWPPVCDGRYVYCSWACRKAHLLETPCSATHEALQALPTHARRAGHLAPIKPAPPRETLSVFGGPLSIEEFRAVAGDPKRDAFVLPEHMVTERVVFELRRQQSDAETYCQVFEQNRTPLQHSTAGCNAHQDDYADVFDGIVASAKPKRNPLGALMTKKK